MTKLLLWKQKVKEFYGEHDFWITPLFKFLLAFVVFSQINGLLGFMRQIDNIFVVLILSLICAMFSINVMTMLACLLILGHCYAVGIETAGFAAVLLILLLILFLRFTSEDNVALILTPISFTLHIPGSSTGRLWHFKRSIKRSTIRMWGNIIFLYETGKRQSNGTSGKRNGATAEITAFIRRCLKK